MSQSGRPCNVEDLHGMTVVVETKGPRLFVGRFDQAMGEHYLLHDADVFEEAPGGPTRAEYLAKAAAYGVWAKEKDCYVTQADVASIRRLSEFKSAP